MRFALIAVLLITLCPLAHADVETAKKAYAKAITAYNLQSFADALELFRRAYQEKPDPSFLFNIAQCQRQLGQYDAAAKSYRAFLNASPEPPPNSDQVRSLIGEMDRAADIKRAAAATAATPAAAPSPSVAAIEVQPPRRPWYRRTTGVALLGAGVAVAVTGIVLLGIGASDYGDAQHALTLSQDTQSWDSYRTMNGAGWPLVGVGGASIVVGAIAVGVGR